MAAYISELGYDGPADFIEVAVTAGVDVSGYSILYYDDGGSAIGSMSFGAIQSTAAGKDAYLFDDTTPGYITLDAGLAYALIDDTGSVLQFVSLEGKTTTAVDGAAAGMTSTSIGQVTDGDSLESSDGGSSYAVQTAPNPGMIPCFASGTMIETPDGPRAVETLTPGCLVMTHDRGSQPVKWVQSRTQVLDATSQDGKPVLIRRGALGTNIPSEDLIVSPQHRILVGSHGQLQGIFPAEYLVAAKALTGLAGIRFMNGKKRITWHHIAFGRHQVVTAAGCYSESLLLGPMVLKGLTRHERQQLHVLFQPQQRNGALNGALARPNLGTRDAQYLIKADGRRIATAQGRRSTSVMAAAE